MFVDEENFQLYGFTFVDEENFQLYGFTFPKSNLLCLSSYPVFLDEYIGIGLHPTDHYMRVSER